MTRSAVSARRRKLGIAVVASIVIFAIGQVIDRLPSPDTHDRYWVLFVAPAAIAFIIGSIAIGGLPWSYSARRRS